MTARTLKSASTCLTGWSILVMGNSMPPRDPNDDDDDEEEEEDEAEDGEESDEDEPAVIREPDE